MLFPLKRKNTVDEAATESMKSEIVGFPVLRFLSVVPGQLGHALSCLPTNPRH